MKTLRIASMILMLIITVFCIVFAQIQRGYAEEALMQAKEQEELAIYHLEKAEEQKKLAQAQTAMARHAENNAMKYQQELLACQGSD